MSTFDYIKEARRTLSNRFYGDLKYSLLNSVLFSIDKNCENLNRIKKWLFYGSFDGIPSIHMTVDKLLSKTNVSNNMLHCIIGIITESGELAKLLYKTLNESFVLDKTNLIEEIGDLFWYVAIICDELNIDFEQIQKININKLKARYPEKFTEEKAIERNLQNERDILQNSVDKISI